MSKVRLRCQESGNGAIIIHKKSQRGTFICLRDVALHQWICWKFYAHPYVSMSTRSKFLIPGKTVIFFCQTILAKSVSESLFSVTVCFSNGKLGELRTEIGTSILKGFFRDLAWFFQQLKYLQFQFIYNIS